MKTASILAVIALTAGLTLAAGCSHGKAQTDVSDSSAAIDSGALGSSDDGKALGLQSVHFAFDSNLLDAETKKLLKANAAILSEKAGVSVQLEGHCDARGGIQYNIALGERRAQAVRSFLVKHGVPAARLTTVSYGKERPFVQGDSEEAYAKNRRVAFVITASQAVSSKLGRN